MGMKKRTLCELIRGTVNFDGSGIVRFDDILGQRIGERASFIENPKSARMEQMGRDKNII